MGGRWYHGALIISSFAGAMIAYQLAGVGRLPICLAAGVLYDLVLLGCNALFFDGRYQNLGINALVILGGCGAAALLGLGKGERRKKGHPSRRYKW